MVEMNMAETVEMFMDGGEVRRRDGRGMHDG